MTIQSFEEMKVWQKAKELCLITYKIFSRSKDYGFRDQIQRASVSIMNNIAEGFERKGNKELARFLYISKGSCGEVRSMLQLGFDLGYIDKEDFDCMYSLSIEISKMLAGFIRTL
jgi:four helix bundle protein